MGNRISHLREFGDFRLDAEKKILWYENAPVNLPLKEIELLCLLTEHGGEVVTRTELLDKIWTDSFVEESNLSRHVYLLRKTLRDLGEGRDLIQTVPRRGYRFAGEVRFLTGAELIIEKRTESRTLIEIEETVEEKSASRTAAGFFSRARLIVVALVAVALGGLAFTSYRNLAAKNSGQIKSLAVLPFKTLGGAKSDEHPGLGLADVLITRLTSLKNLNVRPTSAVAAFENQPVDSALAARKLDVDAVLEGSIYRTENSVRVTMQLLRAGDEKVLWSGQFEKPRRDEMKIQDEIAVQVTNALAINLNDGERRALLKNYTENADAFELYQQGRLEWNKRSWQGMIEAERLFRNAIEKDPNFALAYVGLADRLATTTEANEAFQLVEKALELDPDCGEAHATLGFLHMFQRWDWPAAETELRRSVELAPGYATGHHWLATLLEIEGRHPEARAEFERALEINPRSHNLLADLGQNYYFERDYAKAGEYCRKALEIYPDFIFAHQYLFEIYRQTGQFDLAFEEFLKSDEANHLLINENGPQKERHEKWLVDIRELYRKEGFEGFLLSRIRAAAQTEPTFVPVSLFFIAQSEAFLGNKEKALDSLEKAYEKRALFTMPFVRVDPVFDNLRGEPRFQEILRKMNL
ncbi:MAG: winged helix-turn-helix domain-containing protein [Acidobacteria bacterium]|nr:winged helix-turn-helix domain-containing protein [Acidobacteriota bacterium]